MEEQNVEPPAKKRMMNRKRVTVEKVMANKMQAFMESQRELQKGRHMRKELTKNIYVYFSSYFMLHPLVKPLHIFLLIAPFFLSPG